MLSEKGVLWRRRSRLDATAPEQVTEKEDALPNGRCESVLAESNDQAALAGNIEVRPRILLVDTIGELGAWWGTSHIAFVGGSIHRRGGQNMIEPAAYGAAVCFGPNTKNFRDIVSLLLRDDAAVVVHDQREMEQFVHRCLEEPEYARSLGRNAKTLVERQLGATQRTLELLERVLETGAG
ncbi:MAG TPA: hypothetical protein DEB39_10165 [Planctomycetaceae bacterium]|nr:hypothetical protein [Planctomycetaceae bacterium]